MKTILAILLTAALAVSAFAQNITITNANGTVETYAPVVPSPTSGLSATLQAIGQDFANATNYGVDLYGTYAAQAKDHVGGGILGIYNVNNYIGTGIGIDWLGSWSLVSGNVKLQLPVPIKANIFGMTNIVITPFIIAGVGTSLSGGGGVTSIAGAGGAVEFGHLWGGKFNLGASYNSYSGAGDESGPQEHLFFGWTKGF